MSCYHPLQAYRTESGGVVFDALSRYRITRELDLPCGQCLGCRLDRARSWSLRIMHEASLYDANCFVTLTYGEATLPPYGGLRHRDFQMFMKRLRRLFAPRSIRYYMCGEYGESFQRPHYHACLFNISFSDRVLFKRGSSGADLFTSPTLSALWPFGHSSVGELTLQSAGYTARYVITKVAGELGSLFYGAKPPPYNAMSLKPGLGSGWLRKFASDVVTTDTVVDSRGRRNPVPTYYDRYLARHPLLFDLDQVKADRSLKALPHRADNTPQRLRDKETVKRAQVRSLIREL